MSSRPSRGAARLAAILDALPDALVLVNANGTVVNANTIALEAFEAPGTALVGRGLLDLLPEFDSRLIPGSMRRPETVDPSGRTKPARMIARRTDGSEFPVEVTSANLENGQQAYDSYGPANDELLMLVVRDLSGAVDTEAELARSQRQTEMILRAAAEGVVGTDTDGRVVLVNPAAAQILGYRASDLGGQELHSLILHSRADGEPFAYEESPLADTLRSGRKHRVRGQVLWSKSGDKVSVDLTTAPVRDGDQLVGAVMTFTDRRPYDTLAEEKDKAEERHEQELARAAEEHDKELAGLRERHASELAELREQHEEELAAGDERYASLGEREKDRYEALAARHEQLLAVLSLSLRGPLDQLRGELSKLAADDAGQLWPEANQVLHHLAAGYSRITTLVDNVLGYQRLDSGAEEISRTNVMLDAVVAAGVEGAVELIGPGRVQFAVHAPPIEAEVDPQRLANALAHLIADVAGVDATGNAPVSAGGYMDNTVVVAAAQRGEVVRIEVRGPYAGGDPVHEPIVRGTVRAHGGVLQTHEVPGMSGSAFVLEVPIGGGAGAVPAGAVTGSELALPEPASPRAAAGGGPGGPPWTPSWRARSRGDRPGPRRRLCHCFCRRLRCAHRASAAAYGGGAGGRLGRRGRGSGAGDGSRGLRRRWGLRLRWYRAAARAAEPGRGLGRQGRRWCGRRRLRGCGRHGGRACGDRGRGYGAGRDGASAGGAGVRAGRARAFRAARAAGRRTARAASGVARGSECARHAERGEHAGDCRRRCLRGRGAVGRTAPACAGRLGRACRHSGRGRPYGVRSAARGGGPLPRVHRGSAAGPAAPPAGRSRRSPARPDRRRPPRHDAARPGRRSHPAPAAPRFQPDGTTARGTDSGAAECGGDTRARGSGTGSSCAGSSGTGGSGRGPRRAARTRAGRCRRHGPAHRHSDTGTVARQHRDPRRRRPRPAALAERERQPEREPERPRRTRRRDTGTARSGTGTGTARNTGSSRAEHPRRPQHRPPARAPRPAARRSAAARRGRGPGRPQLDAGTRHQRADARSGRTVRPPARPEPAAGPPGEGTDAASVPDASPAPDQRRRPSSQARHTPEPTAERPETAARPHPQGGQAPGSRLAGATDGAGRSYAIGAPDENADEGPEPLDGPGGAVEVADQPRPQPMDDELPPEPLDNPRRLLVWPAPDVMTQQALSDRGYRPVIVHSREEVDSQIAAFPAALFVDPLTGPITRTALQSLRQAAVAAEVPVLVTAGLGQATREAAYGADPAVLLKALAPRDSEQHPPRVLLIEEHAEISLALTATLERRGMQVARASTDADAVTLASQMRPNLVVMDLMQVRRRQAGIVDWLRANGQLNRTPLVVYTAAVDQAELPRLASGESVLFLAERSTSAEVQERIVDLLARIGTN